MDYIFLIFVFISIFVMLAASLDLLAGHTGILSLAHAAFYGLGAYTSAILAVTWGMHFLVGFLAGILVAAFFSLLISFPSLRLRDDYFVIATFGFQVIMVNLFNNLGSLTGGPRGISAIPRPTLMWWEIDTNAEFALLTGSIAALAYLIVYLISTSSIGRVLRAIREDEIFAQSLGKHTFKFKLIAFGVSSSLAALAGSLYAHFITHIEPVNFTITESVLVISMIIIGGAGSTWGPLVGATSLIVLPEILRFLGLPVTDMANIRQLLYGALLVLMMMMRPQGLIGRYGFER